MNQNIRLSAFFCGLLFAVGLGFSGMTLPSKVIGFLDLFGQWDPSLIFVMGGALITHALLYPFIRRKPSPVFARSFQVPPNGPVTVSLVVGAILFGLGWGLAGYCPAPVLVSLASLRAEPFLFVGAMLIGMLFASLVGRAFKNTSS